MEYSPCEMLSSENIAGRYMYNFATSFIQAHRCVEFLRLYQNIKLHHSYVFYNIYLFYEDCNA